MLMRRLEFCASTTFMGDAVPEALGQELASAKVKYFQPLKGASNPIRGKI